MSLRNLIFLLILRANLNLKRVKLCFSLLQIFILTDTSYKQSTTKVDNNIKDNPLLIES